MARRKFFKQAAERAFKKAADEGRDEVKEADIVKEAGDPQKPLLKSEPVRFDKLPDYSLTETMHELERSNEKLSSIDQAYEITDEKVTRLAPVRLRIRPTQELRSLLDLIRVFGHAIRNEKSHPLAA